MVGVDRGAMEAPHGVSRYIHADISDIDASQQIFAEVSQVAEAFWVPLGLLRDPTTTRESSVHVRGSTLRVPSFVVREHIVWGMTERILRQLLARIE